MEGQCFLGRGVGWLLLSYIDALMASNKQLKAKCESQGVLLVPYKENCISCSV